LNQTLSLMLTLREDRDDRWPHRHQSPRKVCARPHDPPNGGLLQELILYQARADRKYVLDRIQRKIECHCEIEFIDPTKHNSFHLTNDHFNTAAFGIFTQLNKEVLLGFIGRPTLDSHFEHPSCIRSSGYCAPRSRFLRKLGKIVDEFTNLAIHSGDIPPRRGCQIHALDGVDGRSSQVRSDNAIDRSERVWQVASQELFNQKTAKTVSILTGHSGRFEHTTH
jgi:hypothetical protein